MKAEEVVWRTCLHLAWSWQMFLGGRWDLEERRPAVAVEVAREEG